MGEEILGGVLEAALDKIFSKKNKENSPEEESNEAESPRPQVENDQLNAAETVTAAIVSAASKTVGFGLSIFLDITTLSAESNCCDSVSKGGSRSVFDGSKSKSAISSLTEASKNAKTGETAGDIIKKWRAQQAQPSQQSTTEKQKQAKPTSNKKK